MKIVPDKKYPNMYRLRWPDKVLSKDMYNKTWAKEHRRLIDANLACTDEGSVVSS